MNMLRRVFNRQVGLILLGLFMVVIVAMAVNVVGIRLMGDIPAWEIWLRKQAGVFFVWRLFLYAGTTWGWLWMRRRVLKREPSPETKARLRRIEWCALASIVMLEVTNWLNQG